MYIRLVHNEVNLFLFMIFKGGEGELNFFPIGTPKNLETIDLTDPGG